MNVLSSNKFKIQSAFDRSLSIVDTENKAISKLEINEKLFFGKLQGFLPSFDRVKVPENLKKIDSLSLYHKSCKDPSEPNILLNLLWIEEVKNGERKYFIRLQF